MKYIKYLLSLIVSCALCAPAIALSANTLSNLSLSNGQLSPEFSAQVMSYTATIDAADTTISASSEDNKATITGTGKTTLNYGPNLVTIKVSGGSGSDSSYAINITRPDNRSSNNNLKSLTISTGNLSFSPTTTIYNVTVDQSVGDVTATATVEDSKATFVDGYGSPKTLNSMSFGNNVIQMKVMAENGAVKTYTVNVNRNDGRSNNSYLSSLGVSHGIIAFDKEILEYSVKVPYSISSLDVTATAEDKKATISSVGGNSLSVGKNVITVTVTAENGSLRPYVITIYRQAEGVALPSNNYLSSLKIGSHTIKLDKNILKYNLLVDTNQPMEISLMPDDPEALVEVPNSNYIIPGNVIGIRVTAQDGSQREYQITIKRKLNIISLIAGLAIIVISFGAALSIVIAKIKNYIAIKKLNVKETVINVQADSGEIVQVTRVEPKDPDAPDDQIKPTA